jgi:dipeptidyl aminopeptidase/acylaminoacyl peptidase
VGAARSGLAALRTGARTPTQIVIYDTVDWAREAVAVGPLSGWEAVDLAEPEPVEVTARDGATLHARLYRAAAEPGSASERLLCWIHGGPTDQWQVTFMPRVAFWRSRGWNVLLPDPRGSTGHGREYQQALHGRWGELDVSDTVDVLAQAQRRGWGDPGRTVVLGGSSGGLTALGVGAQAPELLAGVVATSPVTDLADLAERSHRFERHYTDTLVGPLPEFAGTCRARSPISFAQRLTSRPLLLLHGDSDPVVPVEHSTMLADLVRAAGGDVELHVYPGEGHGFRQVTNQLDEYARVESFLLRCIRRG